MGAKNPHIGNNGRTLHRQRGYFRGAEGNGRGEGGAEPQTAMQQALQGVSSARSTSSADLKALRDATTTDEEWSRIDAKYREALLVEAASKPKILVYNPLTEGYQLP